MPKISAGILLYRFRNGTLEVFLVHPGGPLWAAKDLGVWSIPKGLIDPGEDPLTAAQREFREETGFVVSGRFVPLTSVKTKSGKEILAWAVEGDLDPSTIKSNLFSMEWPPRSGTQQKFPEVDRGVWFSLGEAKHRISPGQTALLEELVLKLVQKRTER